MGLRLRSLNNLKDDNPVNVFSLLEPKFAWTNSQFTKKNVIVAFEVVKRFEGFSITTKKLSVKQSGEKRDHLREAAKKICLFCGPLELSGHRHFLLDLKWPKTDFDNNKKIPNFFGLKEPFCSSVTKYMTPPPN